MASAPIEQPIPPDVQGREDAVEVLRAFVVDGGLSISFTRAFEEPQMWGMMLADIARHAAQVFEKDGVCTEAEALERMVAMFNAGPTNPADLGGDDEPAERGH
jgi:hypothetical protein